MCERNNHLITLPKEYVVIKQIDLNTKEKLINIIGISILIFMMVIGWLCENPLTLYSNSSFNIILLMLVSILAIILYIPIHEAVHALFLKCFGKEKVFWNKKNSFFYVGSKAYLSPKKYIVVALAPCIILGLIIFLITLFLPINYFWCIYMLQIANIASSTGDFYASYIALKSPKDVLIQDYELILTICSKNI